VSFTLFDVLPPISLCSLTLSLSLLSLPLPISLPADLPISLYSLGREQREIGRESERAERDRERAGREISRERDREGEREQIEIWRERDPGGSLKKERSGGGERESLPELGDGEPPLGDNADENRHDGEPPEVVLLPLLSIRKMCLFLSS